MKNGATIDSKKVQQLIKDHFDNSASLAALMEISPQAVSLFIKQGFPLDRAVEVDILSHGEIPWRVLCPATHQRFTDVRTHKAGVSDRQMVLPFDLTELNTLS